MSKDKTFVMDLVSISETMPYCEEEWTIDELMNLFKKFPFEGQRITEDRIAGFKEKLPSMNATPTMLDFQIVSVDGMPTTGLNGHTRLATMEKYPDLFRMVKTVKVRHYKVKDLETAISLYKGHDPINSGKTTKDGIASHHKINGLSKVSSSFIAKGRMTGIYSVISGGNNNSPLPYNNQLDGIKQLLDIKLNTKKKTENNSNIKLSRLEIYECISDYFRNTLMWLSSECNGISVIDRIQTPLVSNQFQRAILSSIIVAKEFLSFDDFSKYNELVLEPIQDNKYIDLKDIKKPSDWLRSFYGFGDAKLLKYLHVEIIGNRESEQSTIFNILLYLIRMVVEGDQPIDIKSIKKYSEEFKLTMKSEYAKITKQ